MNPSAREGFVREAHSERSERGCLNKRTKVTEACAQKIAQSKGKDWDSMWMQIKELGRGKLFVGTLTQESYRDEAETVCHKCYVGGLAPQTQNDAFHNLLTEAVRHWMGEDYWGAWTVDLMRATPTLADLHTFNSHCQKRVMNKCSMITTKLRFSKIVTPFPIFGEHWDPNAVITMADDQGGTIDVQLLDLL